MTQKIILSLILIVGVFIMFILLPSDPPKVEEERAVSYDEVMKKDLIVVAAPSVHNEYYQDVFSDVIDFYVGYANAVLGTDEIRILVDADTREYFVGRVPEQILVEANIQDIWMRDFTTVNPYAPVQFRYTPASFAGVQAEADFIQQSFNDFTDQVGLSFPETELFIDGGNIVDNNAGRVVTTTRFLEDNDLSKEEGIAGLKELLGATEVAILPPDDEVLAHSDGMVMFIEENTIVVNRYEDPFRTAVLSELEQAFPGIQIIEIEAAWDDERWDGLIGSACGVNLNAVVTTNAIYVPHFGDSNSDSVIATISANTTKNVISVPATQVCKMGGSVRCLSWQQSGPQADLVLKKLTEHSE